MEKILADVSCPVVMDEAYMEFAKGSKRGYHIGKHRIFEEISKISAAGFSAFIGEFSSTVVILIFNYLLLSLGIAWSLPPRSFQLVISPVKICVICSLVNSVTGLSLLTAIAMRSIAIWLISN